MTDKQIIERLKSDLDFERTKRKSLQAELKAKEQECEFSNLRIIQLQETLNQYETDLSTKDCIVETCKAQYKELKAELKSAKELREYTYDCCKQAGEELAKNSFEWDGKEKNLVVQAMELNERYDQLKVELEAYKMEAEEGKEINAELKAENENWQKEYWKLEQGNDFLAETNSRLKQTLTEIKEIAKRCGKRIPLFEIDEIAEDLKQILQKNKRGGR